MAKIDSHLCSNFCHSRIHQWTHSSQYLQHGFWTSLYASDYFCHKPYINWIFLLLFSSFRETTNRIFKSFSYGYFSQYSISTDSYDFKFSSTSYTYWSGILSFFDDHRTDRKIFFEQEKSHSTCLRALFYDLFCMDLGADFNRSLLITNLVNQLQRQ